jgi:hypothetical protein
VRKVWLGLILCATAFTSALSAIAIAQELDPRRPRTLTVGAPQGASIGPRGGGARTGRAEDPLPRGALHLAWPRKSLNVTVEHPPLVRVDGTIIVVTSRGDAYFIDGADGNETAKVATAEPPASAPILLSSGRVAYLATSGRAVVLSSERVHSTFVVARDRPGHVAPIATVDGGFVVATAQELVACDSEGRPRHRAKLPFSPVGALLSNGRDVLAIVANGEVLAWIPGDVEAARVGSFEGPVDGNASLSRGLLHGVVRGSQLVTLDLLHGGGSSVRAVAPTGVFLGPPAVRSSGAIGLLQYTATNTIAVTFEPDGSDGVRVNVGTRPPSTQPDGGATAIVAPPHSGSIVDDEQGMAFMTPEGQIGVVSSGGVDTLGESACGTSVGRRAIGQLAPAGKGSFVVACETGTVVKVVSTQTSSKPSP